MQTKKTATGKKRSLNTQRLGLFLRWHYPDQVLRSTAIGCPLSLATPKLPLLFNCHTNNNHKILKNQPVFISRHPVGMMIPVRSIAEFSASESS